VQITRTEKAVSLTLAAGATIWFGVALGQMIVARAPLLWTLSIAAAAVWLVRATIQIARV